MLNTSFYNPDWTTYVIGVVPLHTFLIHISPLDNNSYKSIFLSRNEFAITDTELKLMAAAAITGESNKPING